TVTFVQMVDCWLNADPTRHVRLIAERLRQDEGRRISDVTSGVSHGQLECGSGCTCICCQTASSHRETSLQQSAPSVRRCNLPTLCPARICMHHRSSIVPRCF